MLQVAQSKLHQQSALAIEHALPLAICMLPASNRMKPAATHKFWNLTIDSHSHSATWNLFGRAKPIKATKKVDWIGFILALLSA
jgi:hypothetical protein